jgi:CheY-like chemotaxis protein
MESNREIVLSRPTEEDRLQTGALAGSLGEAVAQSGASRAHGEIMIRRILVVENNQPNRELLCAWLEAKGFEALAAENLEQAFAAIKNQPLHAVLLDVQLGTEDGLSFAEWLRREPSLKNIPVIAVTAQAMVADQERVIQAGCNTCIPKPVDFQLLCGQLQQWLTVASIFSRQSAAEG